MSSGVMAVMRTVNQHTAWHERVAAKVRRDFELGSRHGRDPDGCAFDSAAGVPVWAQARRSVRRWPC
jgi:hypothetical protein